MMYADRTEETPLLIDDIEQEVRDYPTRFGDRNSTPAMILRWRFGVNYFWDVAAWRQWWADYQRDRHGQPAAPPARCTETGTRN